MVNVPYAEYSRCDNALIEIFSIKPIFPILHVYKESIPQKNVTLRFRLLQLIFLIKKAKQSKDYRLWYALHVRVQEA
jgi:hypothetical protein